MPRYIDIENLNLKGIAVFDENLDVLIPLSDVRKALQMTPTADVAPRAEVAREIFEDIKSFLDAQEVVTQNQRCKEVGEWLLHEYIPKHLAELKKKYTGEQ